MSRIISTVSIALVFFLGSIDAAAQSLSPGSSAPQFSLPSADGAKVSLADYSGKIVVLEWFNKGCPFVQKHYRSGAMQELQKEVRDRGAVWLTVNSTNAKHKDYLDAAGAQAIVKEWKINSTAMLDDSPGTVGKAYQAKTTPYMVVIDQRGFVQYQGAIDDAPDPESDPRNARNFIRQAVGNILAGRPIQPAVTKPYGCTVKYAD